jgi:predicted amidohydrolase
MTRVVCQQLGPRVGAPAANRLLTLRAITEAVEVGADLVVLPELATSGYAFAGRDEAAVAAIPASDPLFGEWAAAVAGSGAVVVGGYCELGDDGLLYNTAALVDSSGVVATYRKTHLWDREKLVFESGQQMPPVVDTRCGRVGLLVCYDLEFPELTRSLALRGAELIVAPSNWPLVDRPVGERPPEVIAAMAAARANRVFVACCDRVGDERGVRWTGGTSIVDESGWVVATADGEGAAVAELDLARARHKTLSPRNDALADRRPELYAELVVQEDVGVVV